MPFSIEVSDLAKDDLRSIREFDRRRIVDEIKQGLTHQPLQPTKNRKCLTGFVPKFDHVLPVWELRVGEYRVFYDVDLASSIVIVRRVRRKIAGKTTEDLGQ
jgi:mRNA-degrading endonuclease RelE of RelBE toxin-antitoxin system